MRNCDIFVYIAIMYINSIIQTSKELMSVKILIEALYTNSKYATLWFFLFNRKCTVN